jgi:hypothetical protein
VLAQQAQGSEFKPHTTKKRKEIASDISDAIIRSKVCQIPKLWSFYISPPK